MKKILASLALALFATASIAQNLPSPSFNNVTINGNLNLPAKAANTVMAAPSSGSGAPTFRTLAEVDIPALTVAKISGLQGILDGKAALTSPAFIGVPTGPTAAVGTNTTQLATTAFVRQNAGTPSNMVTTDTDQTITANKTFSNLPTFNAGVLPVARGGTGAATSTGSGSVVLQTSPSISQGLSLNAGVSDRYLTYQTNGVSRWVAGANGSAESGSNAGSNYTIASFADNGSLSGVAMTISRQTRNVEFGAAITVPNLAYLNGGVEVPNTGYFDNSGRVPNTRFVADNAPLINPRSYGATCGSAFDDTVMATAISKAQTSGAGLLITCPVRLLNNLTIPVSVTFSGTGSVSPDPTSTVTFTGGIFAPEFAQIFNQFFNGLINVDGAQTKNISACWFGACSGIADVAPDMRRMFNSGMNNKIITFPGVNYNVCSTIPVGTSPYNAVGVGSGQVGYSATNASNVILKQLSNFKVQAVGATFTTACNASAQNITFLFDRNKDFEWNGGIFVGNRTGLSASTVNAPFQFMNNQRFTVSKAIAASGYFDNGALFEGTFNKDFVIEDNIGTVGQGVDMAFSVNAVYRNNQFTGASSDAANIGFKCFSQIYDGPSVGGNTIGVGDSENVQVIGNKCDNYQTGIVLQNGKHYRITDNYLLNIKGGTGNPAAAILINYVPSGSFQTVGRPVWNVSITGNHIDGLGTTNAGCGVSFGGNAIANGDSLNRFSINGNMFSGSAGSSAVCSDTNSTAKVNNLFVGSNEWSNLGAFFNANASSIRRANP